MQYFNIGDIVTIGKRGTKHTIKQFLDKGTHVSALLTWGENDHCWWPCDELVMVKPEAQVDMFNQEGTL